MGLQFPDGFNNSNILRISASSSFVGESPFEMVSISSGEITNCCGIGNTWQCVDEVQVNYNYTIMVDDVCSICRIFN